jgi:uncharacterized membrane protein YheB (UPF0754 family)
MSDETWISLDALASNDPARAAIVNHLETADGIDQSAIEAAAEQTTLQLLQQLYAQSMDDEADPRQTLEGMGVIEPEDEETPDGDGRSTRPADQ